MNDLRIITSYLAMLLPIFFLNPAQSMAQCSGAPSYTINLTGKPDSIWTSTSVTRAGTCCSDANCVEFVVTLDSMTSGIKLEITSGAIPGGALTYSIGCSGSYTMGQNVCVNGVGPHYIRFCKNGNNANNYQITCLKKSTAAGSRILNQSCTGTLVSSGYQESTITWNSVPNNASYNALLSCLSACDTVTITPSGSMPSSISYRACGTLLNGCSTSTNCDTISVAFVTNTSVDISPNIPVKCFGQATTTVTASGSGGYSPYSYTWSTGATTASINVGNGTYIVSMHDSANCMTSRDTVTVTSYISPITANAGNDTTICIKSGIVSLSGSVVIAGGGLWYGGNGSFSPSNTSLNATYTPTISEKSAGQLTLYLMTTSNNSCLGDTDDVIVTINPSPSTSLTAANEACANKSNTYTTNAIAGATRQWSVTGGAISGSNSGTSVDVNWGSPGTGTLSIKQTNVTGCDSTITRSILLYDKPAFKPIIHE